MPPKQRHGLEKVAPKPPTLPLASGAHGGAPQGGRADLLSDTGPWKLCESCSASRVRKTFLAWKTPS